MKVKIWGTRGSIPSPLRPEQVEEKISQAIRAIWNQPDVDTTNMEDVLGHLQTLPPLVRGTAGGNTPCVEIQTGEDIFIADAGSGIRELGLKLMQGPCGRGEGVIHLFISHCHWDHIQGFPMFLPAFIPGNHIYIYSIHDIETALARQSKRARKCQNEAIYNAQLALGEQQAPLTWPVDLEYMQAQKTFVPIQPGDSFSIGNIQIRTHLNNHPGHACSYRFEDQHSALVYASDAEYKKLDEASILPLLEFFRHADALIFDAQYTLKEVWQQRVDFGHSSAMIGVDMARAAEVKRLLLFHHDPTYSDNELMEIHARAVAYQNQNPMQHTCEVLIAYEGLTLDLTPAGSVALQMLPDDEAAILTPTSVFDESGVDQLARKLADLSAQDATTSPIIDLSQVETLTTASLKSLIALRQSRNGATIVLAAPSEKVQQVIELGGYSDFFAIYPTVEAALTAVQIREILDLPGQMIKGRYKIQNKVGAGRLGIVLKASDTLQPQADGEGQTVAIKILYPSFSEKTVERFLRQAQQITGLNHPHIVKVYAWDKEEGYSFKVEEFVGGQALQDLLDVPDADAKEDASPSDPPLTPAQIMSITLDVIQALEYAHAHGVIHGDLKPQNIFITEDGAKVSGFGLGRLEEGRNLLNVPLLFLTAAYLAPEQILGQPLDARTDLYAFGVILYQFFTGQLPFEGTNHEVMQAHLRQVPFPPRSLNPQISVSLEHVILKLLAQNPNDRYASAEQVRRILSSLIVGSEDIAQQRLLHPLVGREEPVRVLRACWEEVLAGHGQLAFITGEPGIGKTRLAQQVAAQSHAPVLLMGRCQELEGGPAYQLFTDMLKSYFATIPPEFFDEEAQKLLSNFTRIIPEIKKMLPELPAPPHLEPKQEQLRLMASLTQFIERATAERPWFIILDDLQWADQNSLELLSYLSHHLPSMALMIIGIYRDDEIEPGHPLLETLRDLRSHPTYRHFTLGRLNLEDVELLLTHIWQQPVPQALIQKIYRHTAGNPFYVEEVAKGLVDDGSVLHKDGEWHFPALEEIRLPQSVREAVWRRIGRLSPDTQLLLRQAAVLGQTFKFEDLLGISGMSEWEVLEHLDVALEQQLIQEIPGDTMLRFRHAEIQYILYEDLGPLRRRMLHRQAAEFLEQRAQPRPDAIAEELAYHFEEAGEFERAIHYSSRAAQQAQETYANEAALLWYNRTLSMLSNLEAAQAQTASSKALARSAHEALGELLTLIGHYDDALFHYEKALALAEQDHQKADLYRQSAETYERRGEYDLAFKWLERGLAHIKETAPTLEAARIYLLGGFLYHRQSQNEKALTWTQRSLDMALKIDTAEGQQVVARDYRLLGSIYTRWGDLTKAIQLCRESVQIYQSIGDLVGLAKSYNNLAVAYYHQGDWSQASDAYHKSLALRKQVGDVQGQAILINNLAEIHRDQGKWDEALDLYKQSLAIWKQLELEWGEGLALSNMAQVYIYQENWDAAKTCLKRSQTVFTETEFEEYLPELEHRWAELDLKTGHVEQALSHAQRAVEQAVEADNPLQEGIGHRVLGQVHAARAEYELAATSLQRSLQILNKLGNEYQAAKTKLILADLTSQASLTNETQSYVDEAQATFEKLGAQQDLAYLERSLQE